MVMKLYGIAEIAERTGDKAATVSQWFKRGKLPKPDAELAMGPVWTGQTIGPWIRQRRQKREELLQAGKRMKEAQVALDPYTKGDFKLHPMEEMAAAQDEAEESYEDFKRVRDGYLGD